MQLKGIDEVNVNLHAALQGLEFKSITAMQETARIIRYDMDKTPPLIPVGKTGKLRASWFVSSFKTPKGPGLVMGFSANYAVYVHEMVGAHFRRPGAGAKWFEAALKRNHNKMLKIIEKDAKI